jgi:hypothetical protein
MATESKGDIGISKVAGYNRWQWHDIEVLKKGSSHESVSADA